MKRGQKKNQNQTVSHETFSLYKQDQQQQHHPQQLQHVQGHALVGQGRQGRQDERHQVDGELELQDAKGGGARVVINLPQYDESEGAS